MYSKIEIRDGEILGRPVPEHELRLTHSGGSTTLLYFSDEELRDLFHAAGERLKIDWHA